MASANILKRGYISAPSQPARREFKRAELRNRSELLIGQGVKYKYTNKYTNTKHEYLSTSQAWMLNWENFRFVNSWWGLLHLIPFWLCLNWEMFRGQICWLVKVLNTDLTSPRAALWGIQTSFHNVSKRSTDKWGVHDGCLVGFGENDIGTLKFKIESGPLGF